MTTLTYTAGGEDTRWVLTLGSRRATPDYTAALAPVLETAPVLRESLGGNVLLVRVITYAQPGTGKQVWSLDYRNHGDCHLAEYASIEEAEEDYEEQVMGAMAHGHPSPFDVTDVPTGDE
ncbi:MULTISPECIES: hypothetical protein [Streptomyces]|uniref:hypothetical protein n=1 Tax=Streptomyces TaxID=1883 RepID=UPI0004C62C33|nr:MULTISPECIES: hypothetical protein [Streptomyces]